MSKDEESEIPEPNDSELKRNKSYLLSSEKRAKKDFSLANLRLEELVQNKATESKMFEYMLKKASVQENKILDEQMRRYILQVHKENSKLDEDMPVSHSNNPGKAADSMKKSTSSSHLKSKTKGSMIKTCKSTSNLKARQELARYANSSKENKEVRHEVVIENKIK